MKPEGTEPSREMQPVRSTIPIYPIAFALGFVILLMVVSGVSPFAGIRTLAITLLVATLLVAIGSALLRDPNRGGVFAILAILALMGGDVRLIWVVAVGLALLFVERYLIPTTRQTIRWTRVGTIANRLVIIFLLAIGIQAFQMGWFGLVGSSIQRETGLQPGPSSIQRLDDPDIYLILLDGHTRADVAESLFGIDPAPLRDGLVSRGFTMADLSRSNYTLTTETLASLFDQAHVADIPRMAGLVAGKESRPAGAIVQNVVNENATFSMLRDRGYEIEAISSGFEQVTIREADRFVDTGQLNEFEIGMLRRSIAGEILAVATPDLVSSQQRARIRDIFEMLTSAPDRASRHPTFVFAHIPSPHAPWVFNADGSPRTVADLDQFYSDTPASTGLTNDQLSKGYAGQIEDIDRRLLDGLDRLDARIAVRGRPAVTIVFSDHGTWIGADGGDIRLRFKNLLAVRSSGRALELQPDLTLVNLMPSLFNQIFGTPWARRPDTTYWFGSRDNYQFVPVDDPDARASR